MNIHICFFDGKEDNAVKIVHSLSKYGDIGNVIVLADRMIELNILNEKSGIVFSFEHISAIMDDYQDVAEKLTTILGSYKDGNHNVFINITTATQIQAYAARYASLQIPVPSYYTTFDGELKLIPEEMIPELRAVNNYGLMVLKQLFERPYSTLEIMIKNNGKEVSRKTKNKILVELSDHKLIQFTNGRAVPGQRGPRPRHCELTAIGVTFCRFNKNKINSVLYP